MRSIPATLGLLCLTQGMATTSSAAAGPDAPKRGASPWSLSIETGIGYDDNAYISPSDPYVDYAPTIDADIAPVEQSGTFIPLDLEASYDGRGRGKWGLVLDYSFNGEFYTESDATNSNEYSHVLAGGFEYRFGKRRRRADTLRATPFLKLRDKTYFDRDTGEDKISPSGVDLTERFNYKESGFDVQFNGFAGRLPYRLHATIAQFDYEEPSSTAYDSYDHDYTTLGGNIEFRLAKPTKLVLGYDYATRDYDDWRARNLLGTRVAGTRREYVDNTFSASIKQRFTGDFTMYLDLAVVDRQDQNFGYHDYSETDYGLRAIYETGPWRLRAKATWWTRDYDNAFAFEDPAQASKDYDVAEYSVKCDYDLAGNHGLFAELRSVDQKSSDLRFDYSASQFMVGWRWEL